MTRDRDADDGSDRGATAADPDDDSAADPDDDSAADPDDDSATDPVDDSAADPDDDSAGDVAVSIFGVDVVVEESFRTFPWGAGLWRALVAFASAFVLVAGLVLFGGMGEGSLADRVTTIGFVTFHAHNVPMSYSTSVPETSGLARAFRGAFVVAHDHGSPLGHSLDVLDGQSDRIGHFNTLADSGDPDLPTFLYYLVPVSVLVGVGFEYADSHWDSTATDSPLDVFRFGVAIGVGYVAVLLLATVPFTLVQVSQIWGTVVFLPDRYLAVAFGFVYPAVFSSIGAGIVYVRREGIGGPHPDDTGDAVTDDGPADEELVDE